MQPEGILPIKKKATEYRYHEGNYKTAGRRECTPRRECRKYNAIQYGGTTAYQQKANDFPNSWISAEVFVIRHDAIGGS